MKTTTILVGLLSLARSLACQSCAHTATTENPLLAEQNTTYLANVYGTTQYLQLVAPPVNKSGDGTEIVFTITDPSATNGTSTLVRTRSWSRC